MTRAKFIVQKIERELRTVWTHGNSQMKEVHTVQMFPVAANSEENAKFFASTPCGEIKIGVIDPGLFELGKEYYVDFTEAEPKIKEVPPGPRDFPRPKEKREFA